jgi:hypothetical protein
MENSNTYSLTISSGFFGRIKTELSMSSNEIRFDNKSISVNEIESVLISRVEYYHNIANTAGTLLITLKGKKTTLEILLMAGTFDNKTRDNADAIQANLEIFVLQPLLHVLVQRIISGETLSIGEASLAIDGATLERHGFIKKTKGHFVPWRSLNASLDNEGCLLASIDDYRICCAIDPSKHENGCLAHRIVSAMKALKSI